ncbi:MAG: tautomerase family protein [Chloroherpetonaceae bacterium]|nr:tautomerase family protein [Chloroherpetonaceae bacterium]MDW8438031.1 tautomerase family protein [Chloroherpetonaceae bacterium]
MPLVTITLLQGRTAQEKRAIADAVHDALARSGVPEQDRFQRFIELAKDDFIYDLSYPNLAEPRSEKFIVVEILLSVGRSVKVKRELLKNIVANLETRAALAPKDVMIVFKETQWENWAFANGEQIHA